jgi:DNA-binding LacI/PurR family transcriptional regulator
MIVCLNYRPNLSARSMHRGRFFNIGYFAASSDCGEQDFAPFRAGIYDAASEQDFHVMMIRLPLNRSKDPDVVPKTDDAGSTPLEPIRNKIFS